VHAYDYELCCAHMLIGFVRKCAVLSKQGKKHRTRK